MSDLGFDAGLHAAARWRAVRRWVLLLMGVVLFVELAGTPYLRLSYTSDRGRTVRAKYVGPSGVRTVQAGEVPPSFPLLILVPLERPLWSYASEALDLEMAR